MFEPEKKKKRGSRKRYWARIVLLLAIYVVGFGGGVLIYLSNLAPDKPVYPAPPERVAIRVQGEVMNAEGSPVSYRNQAVNVQAPAGTPQGGFEIKHAREVYTFDGTSSVDTASTGCVWGYIEIIGFPHVDFEFGVNNVDYGANVLLTFIAHEGDIRIVPTIKATEIKPALAPEPVIFPDCGL